MGYLDRLPEPLKRLGDASKGEIELLPVESGDEAEATGIVYEDDYMLVVQDKVKFPSGRIGLYGRVIERASLTGNCGTVVVPVVERGVVFLHIFRHATRQWEWELPRGFQEPGISAEENARQEIVEELGVAPLSMDFIGLVKPNTGLVAGEASVFLARLPHANSLAPSDADEGIGRIRVVAIDELDAFLRSHVACGFSLSAILLARLHGRL